ncbi:hypothetical protein CBP52_15590 [Cellulomonas sp. PSBB021]|nr:hypothetical protein CBP52_15590 [Cellulomonas sp. PSBB021]
MSVPTGPPATPDQVVAQVEALRAQVRAAVPPRTDDNLLIGTWNLRAFGDVSPTWAAGPRTSPKRDWTAVALVAAVVEQLDVVALQEVRRSTGALRFLRSRLGPTWRVLASDVTEGSAGNGERLAFLYDSSRVEPSGSWGRLCSRRSRGGPPTSSRAPRTRWGSSGCGPPGTRGSRCRSS